VRERVSKRVRERVKERVREKERERKKERVRETDTDLLHPLVAADSNFSKVSAKSFCTVNLVLGQLLRIPTCHSGIRCNRPLSS